MSAGPAVSRGRRRVRGLAIAIAALALLPAQAPLARAQAGWSASVSVNPFPPAYPSAWEFDPNIASVTITTVPGTDPRYRIAMTMSRGGAVVLSGTSRDRALSPPALSDLVYTPDLIDWSEASYAGSIRGGIDQTERFPEGDYVLRVVIQSAATGRTLAEATAPFTVTYPDPPTILFPNCGDEITTGFPLFQWTPVQVPIQYPIHYVFRIVQVLDGQIPETALSSNVVWFEDLDVRDTNLPYPLGAQPLEAGKTYAWQVQALDDTGQPPATNQGRSEICTFTVPLGISTVPPLTTHAAISLVRTLPDDPFAGSSFAGLEGKPFLEVLRRLDDLVRDKATKSIQIPLPSPKSFQAISLPDAEVSVDSLLGSFAIASRIQLLGQTVDVVLAGLKPGAGAGGGDAGGSGGSDSANASGSGTSGLPGDFIFGMRPAHFDFGSLITPLKGSLLDDFDFDGNLFCLSSSSFRLDPASLPPLGVELFGARDLDFTPGINFDHEVSIPGSSDRLKRACDALGIGDSKAHLSGDIDLSLDDLRSGTPLSHAVHLALTATMSGTDPSWFPEWLDAGPRTVSFDMDSTLHVFAGAELTARLDGTPRTLTASVDAASLGDSGPVVLRAKMADAWKAPFGLAWLDLNDVGMELTSAQDSTAVAITGSFDVGVKRCDTRIEVSGTGDKQTARFTGTVDELSLADALALARRAGLPVPDSFTGEAMTLRHATVSFESSDTATFAISAGTTVLDVDGEFLVALAKPEGADPQVLLGVRIPKFGLDRINPGLSGTPVGGLTVPEVAFSYLIPLTGGGGTSGSGESNTGESETGENGETGGGSSFGGFGSFGSFGGLGGISIPSANLSFPALEFYRPVFGWGGGAGGAEGGETSEGEPESAPGGGGTGGFSLDLFPGLNLGGTLSLAPLGSGLLQSLGITNPDLGVRLIGKLAPDFGAITAGDLSSLVGWHLAAKLPARTYGHLPEWLSAAGGGDRTLDISMDPDLEVSVSDVLAAQLDGKLRHFRFGADLAVHDTTAAGALRGTLIEPWEHPYGLAWLDLKNVGIEISGDTGGDAGAHLFGSFDVGSKSFSATIEIAKTEAGETARFSATVDELGLHDVYAIATKMGLNAPAASGQDPFTLRNVTLSFESADANTFAVAATAKVFDVEGDFLVSVAKREGANPTLLIGVRVPGFPLADLAPPLKDTMVGDLDMPQVAFTIVQELSAPGGGTGGGTENGAGTETGTGSVESGGGGDSGLGSFTFAPGSLSPAAIQFFRPVFGGLGSLGGLGGGGGGSSSGSTEGATGGATGGGSAGVQDFTLQLSPGLNLGGRLPLAPLGPDVLNALGFTGSSPEVALHGSLGLEIGVLSGSGFASLKSWTLHAELPPRDRRNLPDWLELDPNTQRTLDIGKTASGVTVSVTDVMKADLDGARRTFVFSRSLATKDSTAALTLRGEMQGPWKKPYGIQWLDLEHVSIELTAGTEGGGATLASSAQIAGKTFDVSIALQGGKGEKTATFTGSVDHLSASEFAQLIQDQLDLQGPLFDWTPPSGLLDLKQPTITIVVGTQTEFSLSAQSTLFGESANLLFFARKERGQDAQFMLAAKPKHLSLSGLLPDMKSPVLDSFQLPKGLLVLSKSERSVESKDLTPDARSYYGDIFGTSDFRLDIPSGLSLVAQLPLGDLDASNPLKKALTLLAPKLPLDQLVLEGTLPGAILGLGGPSGLAGLSLKAALPAIHPDSGWLVDGQLAIAVTGRPSVGFEGALTVKADDDLLTFLTQISIAVVPAGVELGLLGALETEKPWVAPLGVKWLTLSDVRLKTAINPVSVKFGFLGRMKIGEKDIEVIAMLPINLYTGVPTGIGLQGASEEGAALADIADLQNAMAHAAGRSQPKLPIDELPNMAIKDLDFRFSTLNDPDLDLKVGTTVGGELWLEMDPGEMEDVAGILLDVGLDGIVGRAHLSRFAVGPATWEDAQLDLTVTVPDRHLILDGGLDLGFAAGQGKLTMAKRMLNFDANVKVLGKYACALTGEGKLGLGTSNLTLHGALEGGFGSAVASDVMDAFHDLGNGDGGAVTAAAQDAVAQAEALASKREAAVDAARAVIAKVREKVVAERDETKGEMERAGSEAAAAQRRADAAERTWKDTPRRQVATRAAREKDYLKLRAALAAARTAYRAKKASYTTKAAAVKALKPIDEYPQVQALLADAQVAKERLAARREELRRLKDDLKTVAASMLPQDVSIQSAEFTTKLARAGQGGAVDMKMVVNVDGTRYPLEMDWTFANMKENAAAIVAQLVTKLHKG